VILHLLLICIYAAPDGIFPKSLKSASAAYVYPIFDQKWSMFAPCPLLDHEVSLQYVFEDGSETEWLSPTEDAEKMHRFLRGSHHGELMLAEYNLLYWVNLDIENLNLEYNQAVPEDRVEEFRGGYSYRMAKNYAYGNAIYLFDKEPVRAQMKCSFKNVKTFEEGYLILPYFKWSEE
jgi:hypothetical protein